MKRKGWIIVLFSFLLFAALSLPVCATQTETLREYSNADSLWEILPDKVDKGELLSFLQEESPSNILSALVSKILSWITAGFKDSLFFFCGLCVLLLASCLFETIKKNFASGVESAFDFLFLLTSALFCFAVLGDTLEMTRVAMEGVNTFFLASLPITTVLLTLSGSLQFSHVQTAHLSFVLSLASTMLTKIVFPITRILFCFSFLNGLGEKSMAGLFKFLQKSAKRLCIFFFTTVSAILALRGALANAADSLAMRSVRFAAGTFIPIVGSAVGEGSKTLAASFQLVKTECGVLCLTVLVATLLQPILCIVIQKIALSLAAALGEVLGEGRCATFFRSLNEIFDLILALMISHACFLIFTVTLFLRAKGNV